MSFGRNVLLNYGSQIYMSVAGIAVLPQYLQYISTEAYGLIAFFMLLQSWFNILDTGLTPTVTRETALYRSGATDSDSHRRLLNAILAVFLLLACIGGTILALGTDYLASEWLSYKQLPQKVVTTSLYLAAGTITLRWMSSFYRGFMIGAEEISWLALFNTVTVTARFFGPLLVFEFYSRDITNFFLLQIALSVVELVWLVQRFQKISPKTNRRTERISIPEIFRPAKKILGFTATMTLASWVWIAATQTDKLVLSKMVALSDYGGFALATLCASSILMLSTPLSTVLLPRMAMLGANQNAARLQELYSQSTQWTACLVMPASMVLMVYPEKIVWIWTGDMQLAQSIARILILYTAGNMLMAMSSFPYYLQYSAGHIRLHLLGTSMFLAVLLVALLYLIPLLGSEGAGVAWLITNSLYFTFWVPWIHRKYAPGIHLKWIFRDIAPMATMAILSVLASTYTGWSQSRELAALQIFAVFALAVLASACTTSWATRNFSNT